MAVYHEWWVCMDLEGGRNFKVLKRFPPVKSEENHGGPQ